MKHTREQYEELRRLLDYIGHSGSFPHLDRYRFERTDLDNIREVYRRMEPITKKEIIADLPAHLHIDAHNSFDSTEEMASKFMDVSNLTINHDKVVKSKRGDRKWFIETTSGTTGTPFPVVKGQKQRLVEGLHLMKCRRRIFEGATLQNGFLIIHAVDPYLRNTQMRGAGAVNAGRVFKYMLDSKPKWVFCSTYLLKVFSKHITENEDIGLLSSLQLEFIETTSQKLVGEDRELIENLFNTRIVDNYGCREVWNIAYGCEYNNLHLNTDYLMIDLIDENGNLIDQEGEAGEVIVTNLTSNVMPLIKYRLGDLARIWYSGCPCGQNSPIITLEEGRKCEKLVNTKYYGTTVFRKVLRAMYFWEGMRDISDIRIIQDADFHLSVYMSKESGKDTFFERKFVENSSHLIEGFDKFEVDFFYEYPFKDTSATKEQVFFSEIIC